MAIFRGPRAFRLTLTRGVNQAAGVEPAIFGIMRALAESFLNGSRTRTSHRQAPGSRTQSLSDPNGADYRLPRACHFGRSCLRVLKGFTLQAQSPAWTPNPGLRRLGAIQRTSAAQHTLASPLLSRPDGTRTRVFSLARCLRQAEAALHPTA